MTAPTEPAPGPCCSSCAARSSSKVIDVAMLAVAVPSIRSGSGTQYGRGVLRDERLRARLRGLHALAAAPPTCSAAAGCSSPGSPSSCFSVAGGFATAEWMLVVARFVTGWRRRSRPRPRSPDHHLVRGGRAATRRRWSRGDGGGRLRSAWSSAACSPNWAGAGSFASVPLSAAILVAALRLIPRRAPRPAPGPASTSRARSRRPARCCCSPSASYAPGARPDGWVVDAGRGGGGRSLLAVFVAVERRGKTPWSASASSATGPRSAPTSAPCSSSAPLGFSSS